MKNELKIRLSKYLLSKILNKELRILCKKKNISPSGNKSRIIENITAVYSFQEILVYTQDLRLSGLLNVDSELVLLRNEIGSREFNEILTTVPLNISELLTISSLLDGSKRKAEIISSIKYKEFLEVVTDTPEQKIEFADRIITNARKSLIKSKLIMQTPRTWEYFLNPQLQFFFQDFQVPRVEELYERVKQSKEDQYQLGIFLDQDKWIAPSIHRTVQVLPAENFTYSPGKLANYSGKLGEELAGQYLERQGYAVCRLPNFSTRAQGFRQELELALCPHISCIKTSDEMDVLCHRHNQPHLCSLFTESSDNSSSCPCTYQFPKVCEGCAEKEICFIHEYFSIVSLKSKNDAPKPYPSLDFLAHKKGEHFLVEVKTNSAQTKPIRQRDTIEHMQKFGLRSLLVLVNVPIRNASFQILFQNNYCHSAC